jgi:hypothetical protein
MAMSRTESDAWERLGEEVERDFPPDVRINADNPKFIGRFKRLEKGMTEYGERGIGIFEDRDGNEVSVWFLSTALASIMKRKRPQPGELVAIFYKGKRPTKDGKWQYIDYAVRTESEATGSGSVDWDAIAGDEDDEPALPTPAQAQDAREEAGLQHRPAMRTDFGTREGLDSAGITAFNEAIRGKRPTEIWAAVETVARERRMSLPQSLSDLTTTWPDEAMSEVASRLGSAAF